jgi:hopanoid biosynthesis associated protein HpnK
MHPSLGDLAAAKIHGAEAGRRLVVTADDFGRSAAINAAVRLAHRDGILTAASLMVNEPFADEAVRIARDHPRLGVGLHLVLVGGKTSGNNQQPTTNNQHRSGGAALGVGRSSSDVESSSPTFAGLRFFFDRSLEPWIERELAAQFERFRATGLPLDHVNGHLNFHLHPTVLRVLLRHAGRWGIRHLRLTCDPFRLNARWAGGEWPYRLSHAFIFRLLSAWARPKLRRLGIRSTERVFGLLQNGRVHEDYVLRLLAELPPGDSELYAHPSETDFRHETAALVSPRVRRAIDASGVRLIRYQDL